MSHAGKSNSCVNINLWKVSLKKCHFGRYHCGICHCAYHKDYNVFNIPFFTYQVYVHTLQQNNDTFKMQWKQHKEYHNKCNGRTTTYNKCLFTHTNKSVVILSAHGSAQNYLQDKFCATTSMTNTVIVNVFVISFCRSWSAM